MPLSALVLAGGSGTRFWPASRRSRPKQLLALDGGRSLLQATVDRLAPLVPAERVWVATTPALAAAVREQLPGLGPDRLVVEPAPRNTAPAIGFALARMPVEARRGAVAVLPSDHRVAEPEAFRATLAAAAEVAERDDRVLALGVVPTRAETGFGYLEVGEALPGAPGLREVVRFREKPDRATAERFLAGGRHLWNGGIFVFRGETMRAAIARLAPEVGAGLAALEGDPSSAARRFAALPAVSIDVAVMEKLEGFATLPLECGWDDLGSWQALHDALPGDGAGNRVHGSAVAVDARDNLLFAEQGTIAVVGVEGLVVVRTGDAVLVLPRERAQEVRRIVERLESNGRDDLL